MAFGKNRCQTGVAPADNNYCGGYAMSAVLSDLGKETDPMSVYKEIQNFQQTDSPALQKLIESTKRNETDICLPSSLALYAQENELTAGICFVNSDELIEEETQRCPEVMKQYDSAEQVLENFAGSDIPYCLVFVNKCHWIAVKRKSKDENFSVYDPATGARVKVAEEKLKDYLLLMDKNAGELVITLKPV